MDNIYLVKRAKHGRSLKEKQTSPWLLQKKPNYSTLLTLMSFFSATFFCNIPVLYQQIENRLCIQQVEPLQH